MLAGRKRGRHEADAEPPPSDDLDAPAGHGCGPESMPSPPPSPPPVATAAEGYGIVVPLSGRRARVAVQCGNLGAPALALLADEPLVRTSEAAILSHAPVATCPGDAPRPFFGLRGGYGTQVVRPSYEGYLHAADAFCGREAPPVFTVRRPATPALHAFFRALRASNAALLADVARSLLVGVWADVPAMRALHAAVTDGRAWAELSVQVIWGAARGGSGSDCDSCAEPAAAAPSAAAAAAPNNLPVWHRDGAGSWLHVGLGVRGHRTLGVQVAPGPAAADTHSVHWLDLHAGDVYLGNMACTQHGVVYDMARAGHAARVVAVQARTLLTAAEKADLRGVSPAAAHRLADVIAAAMVARPMRLPAAADVQAAMGYAHHQCQLERVK